MEQKGAVMVSSRALSYSRIALVAVVLGGGLAAVVATRAAASSQSEVAPAVAALALPGPNQFVSGLDLECFNTQGPPLNLGVTLSHLNRVLLGLGVPAHNVVIRELQQTCVPVQKNGVSPAPAALPFIQHVDLACYRIDAAPLPTPITLTLKHLNPVLGGFAAHNVVLTQAVQLCVPVSKNGVVPPPEVLRLVELIDLECFKVDPVTHPTFTLNLKQFNPQLQNIPPHNMTLVSSPRQLCVPVRKNNQQIPPDILNIVQWVDLEKFAAQPPVNLPAVNVVLKHLNPLFTTLPSVPVVLQQASSLMVPVTKNGQGPPLP
jgi:hypothetical protein